MTRLTLALAACAATTCSATATQHWSNPNQLAEIKSGEGIVVTGSAIAAYKAAKTTADTVCAVWAVRRSIAAALKKGLAWAKKALSKFKGALKAAKAMGSAINAAKRFFKSPHMKAVFKGVTNAGRHAKEAARRAKQAAQQAARRAAQAARRAAAHARRVALAARRRAQQAARRAAAHARRVAQAAARRARAIRDAAARKARQARNWARRQARRFKFWPQVSASVAAENAEAEALLLNMGNIAQVARGVAEVMMKVIRKTPWGEKLEASETIVRFIQDRRAKKKMKWQEVVDVACAINVFLPSPKQLASAIFKSKRGLKQLKRSLRSVKNLKQLARIAKAQGKKWGKKLAKSGMKYAKKEARKIYKIAKKRLKRYIKRCVRQLKRQVRQTGKAFAESCITNQITGQAANCRGLDMRYINRNRCVRAAKNWFARAKGEYNENESSSSAAPRGGRRPSRHNHAAIARARRARAARAAAYRRARAARAAAYSRARRARAARAAAYRRARAARAAAYRRARRNRYRGRRCRNYRRHGRIYRRCY